MVRVAHESTHPRAPTARQFSHDAQATNVTFRLQFAAAAVNPENSDNPDMETTKTRDISENPENPEIEKESSGFSEKFVFQPNYPEIRGMVAQSPDSLDSLKC